MKNRKIAIGGFLLVGTTVSCHYRKDTHTMKRVCKYTKADDFIFPLTYNICKARGIPFASVPNLFSAACAACGTGIKGQALAMSASMIASFGQAKVSECPKCGSKRFVGTVIGLTPQQERTLLTDRFFSTLENPEK